MDDDERHHPVDDRARRERRRSTVAGVGGILLIAVAIAMTLLDLGKVVPTVLAIAGVGSLLAGVVSGALQIGEAYRRSDSDFDR